MRKQQRAGAFKEVVLDYFFLGGPRNREPILFLSALRERDCSRRRYLAMCFLKREPVYYGAIRVAGAVYHGIKGFDNLTKRSVGY